MTRQEQIAKLEGLLTRIKVNRERPRVRPVTEATPPPPHMEGRPVGDRAPVVEIAPRAELESISDFELLDEEIVEITADSIPPEGAEAAASSAEIEAEVAFDEEEEEPPVSSRRPIAAESMDQALAGAAEEHEVPVKTPPPESGPQEAAPVHAPPPPAVPQFQKPARPAPSAPIEDELEAKLPQRPAAAVYKPAAPAPAPAAPAAAARPAPIEPVVTRRAEPPAAEVVSVVGTPPTFSPKSFLDLLDASLGLGAD